MIRSKCAPLAVGAVRHHRRGVCTRCDHRAHRAKRPMVCESHEGRPCVRCGRRMFTDRVDRPRPAVLHSGRGLCPACWAWAKGHDVLIDYDRLTRPASEVIEEWKVLRTTDSIESAAQRLGITPDRLRRVLREAA
jgi:hypothetical protein